MGKHFWTKHVDDELDHKQPGCISGLVHALDYHHWHSNAGKMIQHHKNEGETSLKCNWSPKKNLFLHDASEVEKLLDEKESPFLRTKRTRLSSKQSLKSRIKALIAEEMSKDSDNAKRKEGFSFKSKLQRTYSIHHLESLDDSIGKICTDWKHPIIFIPSNAENYAPQSMDTSQSKAADNNAASSGNSKSSSAVKNELKEELDFLDIFKVDKELFIKNIQYSDEGVVRFSHSVLGLNRKQKLSKSRSFPVLDLSQRLKFKPSKLADKQKEIWSSPKGDKLYAVNQEQMLARLGDSEMRSGRLAGDGKDGILNQDMRAEQDKQGNDQVIVPSEIVAVVADEREQTTVDRNGEHTNRNYSHRRSLSLNESVDKYARLFENSSGTDSKLCLSKSLKLINDNGHAPMYVRRIHSLSNTSFHYSNLSFEETNDDPFGNGSMATAKDSRLGPGTVVEEEEKAVRLIINKTDNAVLDSSSTETAKCKTQSVDKCDSMQRMEDDANLNLNASDVNSEEREDFEEETDKLKSSDAHWVPETNCSNQSSVSDSDTLLQEKSSHPGQVQFSEGLESRCEDFDEMNSSAVSDNFHRETLPTYSNTLDHGTVGKTDKFVKNFGHHGSLKKSDSDVFYMRKILDHSGIAEDAFERAWHSSDQPLSPQVFEEVEACWPHELDKLTGCPDFFSCWHHQMLFDLVNEFLLDMYDNSLPYYPKALSSGCHVRPFPVGNHIVDEIITRIGKLLCLTPEEKQSLDCVIAHDLGNDTRWMNLQFESECVAVELEDMIFDQLLEEVVSLDI